MNKAIVAVLGGLALFAVVAAVELLPSSREETPDAAAYRSQIAIEGFYSGRGLAGEDAGMPVVWFRLRNQGDRSVEEVKVHVSFFDRDGRVVHEVDLFPVRSGYNFGAPTEPLEPGGVWQMSNIRYYMPAGIPHTWQVGRASAEVEQVRFTAQ